MKKLIALVLAALLIVPALVACTNNNNNPTTAPTTDPNSGNTEPTEAPAPVETDYKVAMITDYGDITDQSFNQTTYEACEAFCKDNNIAFTYKKPGDNNTAARVKMVDAAVAEGYNVIVMPGYAFAGTIVEAAPKYPDVKFIALDVGIGDLLEAGVTEKGEAYDYNPDNWKLEEYVDMSNVYCAVYQEELCGYMAGYAAVKLGYKELGFLGGMAVPAVVRYGYGFVQGADAAATEMGVKINIKYAYGNQFYGDADITAYMDTWYQTKGVEVVFACGGGIYTSATEAAKKVNAKVIGVDVDQAATINALGTEGMTVTSAMKGLAATVKNVLNETIKNNKWESFGTKVENLGLVSGTDPELNYVQIPLKSTQWSDGFTQDNYKELVNKMFKGEVIVSNSIDAMPKTTITVSEYGNIL